MKFGRNVLHVNTHQLTKIFDLTSSHFQDAAMTSLRTENCYHRGDLAVPVL